MKTVLFQGDSITSARRYPEDMNFRGSGYATMASGYLGVEYPGEFTFINMGVGGDRITDLIARMKCDAINLAPDYMSILIGINDAFLDVTQNNGVSAERFETFYSLYVEDIKKALPNVRMMLLEPYVLKGTMTTEIWDELRPETEKRAAITRKIAEKNELVFVPLMETFDKAAASLSEEYWSFDGIHPTVSGHELIKRAWLEGFQKLL